MRDWRREPANGAAPRERSDHRLTLALWWIALYATIIHVAIRPAEQQEVRVRRKWEPRLHLPKIGGLE